MQRFPSTCTGAKQTAGRTSLTSQAPTTCRASRRPCPSSASPAPQTSERRPAARGSLMFPGPWSIFTRSAERSPAGSPLHEKEHDSHVYLEHPFCEASARYPQTPKRIKRPSHPFSKHQENLRDLKKNDFYVFLLLIKRPRGTPRPRNQLSVRG